MTSLFTLNFGSGMYRVQGFEYMVEIYAFFSLNPMCTSGQEFGIQAISRVYDLGGRPAMIDSHFASLGWS